MNENDIVALMRAADMLKAMSNPYRLSILCMLGDGEHTVTELTEFTGLSQSALSQHLARLRARDLVSTRKNHQNVYYTLKSEEVKEVIATLHKLYCGDIGNEDGA